MQFTADNAFAADEAGDPIMIDIEFVRDIIEEHDGRLDDFLADEFGGKAPASLSFNAATVLAWLGY